MRAARHTPFDHTQPVENLVEKYFGAELSLLQRERFARLDELYGEWNGRINVVSRKDIGQLQLRHVLHSLAIARVCRFAPGARVLDVGSGGGFPGIPLAIMFPEAHFTLCDSIGKKVKVIEAVAQALGLENATPLVARAESVPGRFDYVVSRAVAPLAELLRWTADKVDAGQRGTLPNGMLCLKGGDLAAELAEAGGGERDDRCGERPASRFAAVDGQKDGHLPPSRLGHSSKLDGTRLGVGSTLAGTLSATCRSGGRHGCEFTIYNISEWFGEEFFETKKVVYIPLP